MTTSTTEPDDPFDPDDFDRLSPDQQHERAWSLAMAAVRRGNRADLYQLLDTYPLLSADPDQARQHALIDLAVRLKRPRAVAILLNAGWSPNTTDARGESLLMTAVSLNRVSIALELLDAGADPNYLMSSSEECHGRGRSAFYLALVGGNEELVEELGYWTASRVQHLAYRKAIREDGWSPAGPVHPRVSTVLFMAAQNCDFDRLQTAILAGADCNRVLEPLATNRLLGSTPLSFAAGRGQLDMVEALLAAGADPTRRNHLNWTAADYADCNGHHYVADLIRRYANDPDWHGDGPNLADESPPSPAASGLDRLTRTTALRDLFRAVITNDSAAIDAAVERGADPNRWDDGGSTPLAVAVVLGHRAAVVTLLKWGAGVDSPGDDVARTALWLAIDGGQTALFSPLLAAGADPTINDEAGRTLWDRARLRSQLSALRVAWLAVHGTNPPG